MESFYLIAKATIVFSVVVQFVMLSLQAAALHRHKLFCFWLLCFGSVFGALYAILSGIPQFFEIPQDASLLLFKVATFFGVAGAIAGIWGTASLFRSYATISEATARSSADGA